VLVSVSALVVLVSPSALVVLVSPSALVVLVSESICLPLGSDSSEEVGCGTPEGRPFPAGEMSFITPLSGSRGE
jgi:hypothetical protein